MYGCVTIGFPTENATDKVQQTYGASPISPFVLAVVRFCPTPNHYTYRASKCLRIRCLRRCTDTTSIGLLPFRAVAAAQVAAVVVDSPQPQRPAKQAAAKRLRPPSTWMQWRFLPFFWRRHRRRRACVTSLLWRCRAIAPLRQSFPQRREGSRCRCCAILTNISNNSMATSLLRTCAVCLSIVSSLTLNVIFNSFTQSLFGYGGYGF